MPSFYQSGDLIVDGKDVYLVEEILGKGGMARVYLAKDIGLNKPFVVKVLDPELSTKSSVIRHAFEQEARALAQMGSEHVPIIRSLGSTSDANAALFYVMEHINGHSLKHLLDYLKEKTASRRLGLDRALSVAAQIAEGLGEIHEFGVTHCDIKPDNVLLHRTRQGETRTKLIDFGVMYVHDDRRPRVFMGTPLYAAPEQLAERDLTPKVDVFSLGLVLFEILTGAGAYASFGGTYEAALRRIEVDAPALPREEEFPTELVALVGRMLSLDPDKRPDAFAAGATLRKIARELAPVDPHAVATDPNLRGLANATNTEARPISIADVSTTDLDVDMENLMRQVEAAQRAQADAVRDTEPGTPPRDGGGRGPTARMSVPIHGVKHKTVKMLGRPSAESPHPAPAEVATVPPARELPKPASMRSGIYVGSEDGAHSERPRKQETTPMPRAIAATPTESLRGPTDGVARARERTFRRRIEALTADRGGRALLMLSAALVGMLIALGAFAIGQRALSARASAAPASAPDAAGMAR